MENLFYCLDCRRIFDSVEECTYCKSGNFKKLLKMAPINVIGTKHKGNVLRVKDQTVSVLLVDLQKQRYIKEFKASEIQKII
ncbi:hypothetical protein [Alkaliphilus hydrothermalis]|uniref:Uncharacterized protein YlbG (UPF0298 family) n=1 Tax=Alkaliphilus hydrothermalis TaxID=1482730 RepID=A0ABS2NRC6_9FIRM|nr:hypothetical protein [Alkaliphilus hydrothermalis]MBM7615490.1 uncharacterized protein YlbG (UPF0298 family) [Alkaliphilus hydrothermalis]